MSWSHDLCPAGTEATQVGSVVQWAVLADPADSPSMSPHSPSGLRSVTGNPEGEGPTYAYVRGFAGGFMTLLSSSAPKRATTMLTQR